MNSVATESFAELFEQSQANLAKLKPGAIVKGIVVDVRNDVVVINAGLKSNCAPIAAASASKGKASPARPVCSSNLP